MGTNRSENCKIIVSECDSLSTDGLADTTVTMVTSSLGKVVDLDSSSQVSDKVELLSTETMAGMTSDNILDDKHNVSGLEFDIGGSDLIAHSDICLGSNPLDSLPVSDNLKGTFNDDSLDKDQSVGMTFSRSLITDSANGAYTCSSPLETCLTNANIPVSLPTIQLLPLECQNIQLLTPVSNAIVRTLQLPSSTTNQAAIQGAQPSQGAVLSSAVLIGNMVMLTRASNPVQSSLISTLAGSSSNLISNTLLKTPIKLQVISSKQHLPSGSTSFKTTSISELNSGTTITSLSDGAINIPMDSSNTSKELDVVNQNPVNIGEGQQPSSIITTVCTNSLLEVTNHSDNCSTLADDNCLFNSKSDTDSKNLNNNLSTPVHACDDAKQTITFEQNSSIGYSVSDTAETTTCTDKVLPAPVNNFTVDDLEHSNISKVKSSRSRLKRDKKEQYNCDLCSAVFNRLGNFTRHRMTHTVSAKDDYRYKCDECGRLFLQRCDMKRHMLIHSKQEPYHCQDCGKGYIRKSDLVVHMRFHKKDRPFKCESCPKSFFQSGDLNRHVRNVHLHSRTVMCGHCNRSYAKEATLIRHMQTMHRTIILQSLNINPEQPPS
ncbi:hypothetical protein ScPMuIL_005985 [Solemya velum]